MQPSRNFTILLIGLLAAATASIFLSFHLLGFGFWSSASLMLYCPPNERETTAVTGPLPIRISSSADVRKVREQLNRLLWQTRDLAPDLLPDRINKGIEDAAFALLPSDVRTDVATMTLPHGFVANAYHFVSTSAPSKLAIYHNGHDGSIRDNEVQSVIAGLLAGGFDVMALDMPMRGVNEWPEWIDVPGIGPVSFARNLHWLLAILDRDDFTPLRLYLEPVLRMVNYASRQGSYDEIIMVGLSGGGWTTTVYAALDERIKRSYPVAGSLPFALQASRYGESSIGDYEQRHPRLFRIASYLDLYVLGGTGPGRRQVQILNEFDPCCFTAASATVYARTVADAVATVSRSERGNGSWRLAIDRGSDRHVISARALEFIVNDANRSEDACPSKRS